MTSADDEFLEFIQRIRRGDQEAARLLVQRYERELRIMARVRLTDARLCQILDSMDVCQSIFANFFARAAAGQFELATPDHLLRLLAVMVRNKVTDYARLHRAERRDNRRLNTSDITELEMAHPGDLPCETVATAELLEKFRKKLTPEELQIADMRRDGLKWDAIGEHFLEAPEAIRKRFSRAIDRVAAEVGLEQAPDE